MLPWEIMLEWVLYLAIIGIVFFIVLGVIIYFTQDNAWMALLCFLASGLVGLLALGTDYGGAFYGAAIVAAAMGAVAFYLLLEWLGVFY
jgi:TctA family transporter